jgi:hypothetical protein
LDANRADLLPPGVATLPYFEGKEFLEGLETGVVFLGVTCLDVSMGASDAILATSDGSALTVTAAFSSLHSFTLEKRMTIKNPAIPT